MNGGWLQRLVDELAQAQAVVVKDVKVYYLRPGIIAFGLMMPVFLFFSFTVRREMAVGEGVARLLAIAEHQGVLDVAPLNSGSRGVVDLDDNPNSGKDEKELSRDTTLQDTTNDRTRGEGK